MARVRDLWHDARTGARTSRYGKGKRWQAVWDTPDGGEQAKSFSRKIDAEQHLARTIVGVADRTWVDPAAGRLTVTGYGQQWLAAQIHLRPKTRSMYESNLRVHVYPALGGLALAAVTPETVQRMVTGLAGQGLAPSTVELAYRVATILFRAAVRDRRIAFSPCERINLPERSHDKAQPLRVEHVHALAAALPARLAVVPLLGAGTGLRPSELLGVELDPRRSLDMLRRVLLVRQQLRFEGAVPYLGRPKTRASVRDVPAGEGTLAYVAEHLAAHPAAEVVLEDRTLDRPRPRAARLLVTGEDGRPLSAVALAAAYRSALPAARAAVDAALTRRVAAGRLSAEQALERSMPERVVPHSTRHAYASWLIEAGVHPKVIQARLGHASITETLDTYGHLMADEDDRTRGAIDDAWSRTEETTQRNEEQR